MPRSSVATPSSEAISRSLFSVSRYSSAEVRDATFSPPSFVSCVTISACTPSSSGTTEVSPLMLSNGSTATERSSTPDAVPKPARLASSHATTDATSVSPSPSATRRRVGRSAGIGAVGATGDGCVGSASAAENCPTGLNRSAGAFARARISASLTAAGTAGRNCVTGGGGATMCWRTRLSVVTPVNGGCPASNSYSTQPRL